MMLVVLLAGIVVVLLAALGYLGLKLLQLRRRYRPIIDVDREIAQRMEQLEGVQDKFRVLEVEYATARATYDRLTREVNLLEENLEDLTVGLYKPHYDYDSSERYRTELEKVRTRQKEMYRAERAVAFVHEWTVNNSKAEGRKLQKQQAKLMLRAFNGEVEAAIGKVTWNNAVKMEERIRKAFEQVNQQGTVMHVSITPDYLALALQELRLEHELEEKRREEQEEQRRIKEQIREEERAQREAQKAQDEAEAEEERYQKALDKARAEAARAHGAAVGALDAKVRQLEEALAEAHRKKERALSMAQQTKSGHVYIVSNIGSFGDGVFKIGMTRRLEPLERVKELGDASVPFEFDVHAMVYSEDAPGLENAFHRQFAQRRVNLINARKEFFAVTIAELEAFTAKRGLEIELTKLAEAREYRETMAMRAEITGKGAAASATAPAFPDALTPESSR